MRPRLIIAMAIGAFISMMLLLATAWLFPGIRPWAEVLEVPGIIVIMLVWGPHGPAPDILSLAVVWAVNATVYGLVALAVVNVLKISN